MSIAYAAAPSSAAELAEIVGSVDDLGRPVACIEISDRDSFIAVVDTGFRSLLLLAAEAEAMGFLDTH